MSNDILNDQRNYDGVSRKGSAEVSQTAKHEVQSPRFLSHRSL